MFRVLHLRKGDLYGGVESVLVARARLRSAIPQIEPAFAICFDGQLSSELQKAGADTIRLGNVRIRYPWTVWTARMRLLDAIVRRQTDVVVLHTAWEYALFAKTVRLTQAKLVLSLHEAYTQPTMLHRAGRHWPPDLVLCNSQFVLGTSRELFPQARHVVIRNPIQLRPADPDPSERQRFRKRFGAGENDVVVILHSRLEPWKGHELLFEALSRLTPATPWRCWILGAPQRPSEARLFTQLKSLVESRGLVDRVVFHGQQTDVSPYLAAADLHCQPNTGPEPFGNAFVEAMSAGLPVVTTRLGGAIEIVDGSCGLLVRPGAEELASALQSLMDDRNRRDQLANAARSRAAQLCDPIARMQDYAQMISDLAMEEPLDVNALREPEPQMTPQPI